MALSRHLNDAVIDHFRNITFGLDNNSYSFLLVVLAIDFGLILYDFG